jgi:GrpB-like predicted nucleotidyltransferase (UPF0157 family)
MSKLNQMSPEELGMLFPIAIVDYCPGWPLTFLDEKRKILEAMDEVSGLQIDHIGSTAIPGLAAKPTIDILIQITSDTNQEKLRSHLKDIGYQCIPKPENPPPHMMFVKGYTENGFDGQAFHIHVRYHGDWDELIFLNYLKQHPKTAREYESLKKELAVQFKNNREDYTDGKTAFVARISQLARKPG